MGLSDKKQTQQSTQTQQSQTQNQYGWQTKPSTPDLDNLRNQKFEVDPGLSAQYGRQRQQLEHGFNQPTGAYYSPQVKDAMLRSGRERLGQQEAEAYRGGQFDKNKLDYSRNLAVAGMSDPVLTQTGSSSTGTGSSSGTVKQSESPWGTIAQVGAAAAPMSL